MSDFGSVFEHAFNQASKVDAHSVANLVRFIGVSLLAAATALAMVHFLSGVAKENELFIPNLAVRIVKIVIGLSLFVLVLKP